MKILKVLNVILVFFTLFLIYLLFYPNNNSIKLKMKKNHSYVCSAQISDDVTDRIYTYNIATDINSLIVSNNYIEKLLYKSDDEYKLAKKKYELDNLGFEVTYDDSNNIIILSKNIENEHYFFETYKNNIMKGSLSSNFICEEI